MIHIPFYPLVADVGISRKCELNTQFSFGNFAGISQNRLCNSKPTSVYSNDDYI